MWWLIQKAHLCLNSQYINIVPLSRPPLKSSPLGANAQQWTDFRKGTGDKGNVVTTELVGKIKWKNPFMPMIYSEHISLGTFFKQINHILQSLWYNTFQRSTHNSNSHSQIPSLLFLYFFFLSLLAQGTPGNAWGCSLVIYWHCWWSGPRDGICPAVNRTGHKMKNIPPTKKKKCQWYLAATQEVRCWQLTLCYWFSVLILDSSGAFL